MGIIQTLINIGCALIGCIIGVLAYRKTQIKEIQNATELETKEKVQQNVKLDLLLTNNTEMKNSMKELDKKMDSFKDDFIEKITRVEESCKQAHKRIDQLELKK